MSEAALQRLAQAAGIEVHWKNARGEDMTVPAEVLGGMLDALGIDAGTPAAIEAETARLEAESAPGGLLPLVTAESGEAVRLRLPAKARHWRLVLEDGRVIDGPATPDGDGLTALPPIHVAGYHTLEVGDTTLRIAAAPERCFTVDDLPDRGRDRLWALAVQLYGLRRPGDGGVGDFSALESFSAAAARHGASAVAISPVHAMFAADPQRFSPYAPSSRLFLNGLFVDPAQLFGAEAVAKAAEQAGVADELRRLEGLDLIDWPAVARAKLALFRTVFTAVLPSSPLAESFAAFRPKAVGALEDHARFEALLEHFFAQDTRFGSWRAWPQEYRSPHSPAVEAFAREHAADVDFHVFVQWMAERGLAAAQDAARTAGLPIGLIADLAVGTDGGGSHAWTRQDEMLIGLSAGAPPDIFNPLGQSWGLSAFSPAALRRHGFRAFLEMLRAAFASAGGVRIDHAMGLMRLWLVPDGASPAQGAYLRFPFQDLLRLIKLESQRHKAIVVGEDLGTVPAGFSEPFAAAGILGMRVLFFERDEAGFTPPENWSDKALAMTTTHDLPTVSGWWTGADIALRGGLNLLGEDASEEKERAGRAEERRLLAAALAESGAAEAAPDDAEAALDAAIAYIGLTPSPLAVLPLEDALGAAEQPNLPGTVTEHPNWRRRIDRPAADVLDDPAVARRLEILRSARATPVRPRRERARQAAGVPAGAAPRATARLQFHKDFTLDDAVPLVPYFARLGASHLYASPILRARSGSMHGYDVADPTVINPELGGEAALERLVSELRAHGLGLILDIVPNHMGVGPENPWWTDMLARGPDSPYAGHFDVDWNATDPALTGKILLPVLGSQYGEVLASGDLTLAFDEKAGRFSIGYYDARFPIRLEDYAGLIESGGGEEIASTLSQSVARGEQGAEEAYRLLRLLGMGPGGQRVIAAAIAAHDGTTEEGRARLHALAERQHYRLAWWRTASDEINWRRFFDVNELAGLRIEQDAVFEAAHAKIFELYARGMIDGVRVDHVDGLVDPAGYCRKLRARLAELEAERPDGAPGGPAYLVVEKILAFDEKLRTDWAIDGTSGYDFMDEVSAVLHDGGGEAATDALWREISGASADFEDFELTARRQIIQESFTAELENLSRLLQRIARQDLATRDTSRAAIRRTLAELLAHFPVYRTYAGPQGRSAEDDAVMARAIAGARPHVRPGEEPLLDLLDRWLGGEAPDAAASEEDRALRLAAIGKFQQLSSPVAAKSVEDTAFYRFGRLLSRNEVGSNPGVFAISPEAFHERSQARAADFPHALLATATHDHKRGEDVRTRLAVLSEIPEEWAETVRRWRRMNAALRGEAGGVPAPDPVDEFMLYQTLVGALPPDLREDDAGELAAFAERVAGWQLKATREAKRHSRWTAPNEAYEAAARTFMEKLLTDPAAAAFRAELIAFVARIGPAGVVNSLAQTLLRLTAPGLPDLYQGTEFWDFSLVDPDNRRPVDFAARLAALEAGAAPAELIGSWQDGRVKQAVVARALAARAERPDLFAGGTYEPLTAEGPAADSVLAFARRQGGALAVTVVARCAYRLLDGMPRVPAAGWGETRIRLPDSAAPLVDVMSGRRVSGREGYIPLAELLARFPVALLLAANQA